MRDTRRQREILSIFVVGGLIAVVGERLIKPTVQRKARVRR